MRFETREPRIDWREEERGTKRDQKRNRETARGGAQEPHSSYRTTSFQSRCVSSQRFSCLHQTIYYRLVVARNTSTATTETVAFAAAAHATFFARVMKFVFFVFT
jgi:hypothetical protein